MNMQVPALTVAESSLPATLRDALDSAADLARAEKATATKRAYGSDFAIFRAWCADQGLSALPADPAAVAAFIAAEAGRGVKCSTSGAGIRRVLCSRCADRRPIRAASVKARRYRMGGG
jgi:hypothetical protein